MCIRPGGMKDLYFPMLYLNNNVVKVVTKEKYLGGFFLQMIIVMMKTYLDKQEEFMRTGNVLVKNVNFFQVCL